MNLNNEHIDLFDRYLRQELKGKELSDFENRIREEEEFAEAFKMHQMLSEGIREHGRTELKNFLKDNGRMMYWGENFWPKKMRFAAAAVFILFAGLYVIIKFYIEPKKEKTMASGEVIKNEVLVDPGEDTVRIDFDKSQELADLEKQSNPEITLIPPPPEIQEERLAIEEAETDEGSFESEFKESADAPAAAEREYNVLTDVMLKDTFIALAVVDFTESKQAKTSGMVLNTKTEKSKKAKSAQYPYNSSNKMSTEDNVIFLDSSQIANNKTIAVEKTTIKKSVSKVNIQYWKSPVNFRGYKYINNTIQIYGLEESKVRFYSYNNKIYLRTDGLVYVIAPCQDSCPFKLEVDNEITRLILIQK